MTQALLCGTTGLVGSNLLTTLLQLPSISAIHAFARRDLKTTDSKLRPLISDSTQWSSKLSAIQPAPAVFFSALGTTRAQAGGFENQRKIDYDLNLELAKAAKAAGVKTYVLISSSSAHPQSTFAYTKMKGELEEAVKQLDFEHTVIVRPGLIVGTREDSRLAEAAGRKVANFIGAISGNRLKDAWAQDADVIARAAVNAGMKTLEGDAPKVWLLAQPDVVRLGRTEWKA